MQGKALYDFQGDTSQGELTFNAGDIITIVRQDIGEGWWEGAVGNGTAGLLPASYIELLPDTAAVAPPPIPQAKVQAPPQAPPQKEEEEEDDDWDDSDHDEPGWDEDEEEIEPDSSTPVPRSGNTLGVRDERSFSTSSISRSKTSTMKKTGKGWIRSSAYVATGADEYLTSGGLGSTVAVNPSDYIDVADTKGQGPGWKTTATSPSEVKVYHAGAKKKGRGFSTYTHYNIIINNSTVERRMKHFQWLHDRLCMKYTCIAVPPLPDFKFLPKFGEESIPKKVDRLQAWITRVMRHPVLRHDRTALKHFLEIEYEGKDWKSSKKRADKDPLVGRAFFDLIRSDTELNPAQSLKTIESFGKFQSRMKTCVEKVQATSLGHSNRMFSGIRKEYVLLADSMNKLSDAVGEGAGTDGNSVKLSMALRNAGTIFTDIGEHTARQPINDEIPWMESLKEYQALISQFDNSVKSSVEASKKYSRLMEGKHGEEIPVQEKEAYRTRLDNINTVTLCEINNFNQDMKKDFKTYMQKYLKSKLEYHQQLATDFTAAKTAFDSLPF
eukprot:m.160230 g.160230  ORF g.160230 m.160230 type:complete len:553 (-) comp31176_c0_seq1:182-1840(-)